MLSLTDVCVSGIDVIDDRVPAIQVVLVRLDPVRFVHNGHATEHMFARL